MAIKPILFNSEMVQAILERRKTQTRRIIKGLENLNVYRREPSEKSDETCGKWDLYYGWWDNGVMIHDVKTVKAPCSIGDVLWVRETWDKAPESKSNLFKLVYYYRADGDMRPRSWRGNWNPSIHMPKEAARIFLKVKSVKPKRLQSMTDKDAECEGAGCFYPGTNMVVNEQMNFINIWNDTIKPAERDKYGWNANPWVWVIEFERCEKPENWDKGEHSDDD